MDEEEREGQGMVGTYSNVSKGGSCFIIHHLLCVHVKYNNMLIFFQVEETGLKVWEIDESGESFLAARRTRPTIYSPLTSIVLKATCPPHGRGVTCAQIGTCYDGKI